MSTGTAVTPYFDPLLTKLIVTDASRSQAIKRMAEALEIYKVLGPPNNIELAQQIAKDPVFGSGQTSTNFLKSFECIPW